MLPIPASAAPPQLRHESRLPTVSRRVHPRRSEYLHRLLDFHQIDWEFAIAQMICLCVAPRKVYQFVDYRKQTKNTMVRDDPGFVILLLGLLSATSLAYCIALQIPLFGRLFLAVLFPAALYLLTGAIVATAIYSFAKHQKGWPPYRPVGGPFPGSPQPDSSAGAVEWGYCFDVHTNGVFPVFLICSVLQYLMLPLLLKLVPSSVSTLLSNALYAAAGVYYCYIASLGYSRVSNLPGNAVLLLYPTVIIIATAVLLTLCGVNLTKLVLRIFLLMFQ